jgi:DNA-binding LytR/AlgR family response regulator
LEIKSAQEHIEIVTKYKIPILRRNTFDYLNKCPQNFFRIHCSYAISKDYLEAVESSSIIVGNRELPIVKANKDELLPWLKLG